MGERKIVWDFLEVCCDAFGVFSSFCYTINVVKLHSKVKFSFFFFLFSLFVDFRAP